MARASVKDAAGRQQGAGHHVYHRQEKTSDWNNSNAPAVAITVGDDDQKIYAEMQVGRMIDLNSKPQHLQSQSHLIKVSDFAVLICTLLTLSRFAYLRSRLKFSSFTFSCGFRRMERSIQ